MITISDYFGSRMNHPQAGPGMYANADELLGRVNRLLDAAKTAGAYDDEVDPDTGTQVSGSKGGSGDGGWRPSDAMTGAPNSKHKQGKACDVYDVGNKLDDYISMFDTANDGNSLLEQMGLWREHPSATAGGWVHLQSVAPGSGKRTFQP